MLIKLVVNNICANETHEMNLILNFMGKLHDREDPHQLKKQISKPERSRSLFKSEIVAQNPAKRPHAAEHSIVNYWDITESQ